MTDPYRRPGASVPPPAASAGSTMPLVAGLGCSLLAAVIVTFVVPPFRDALQSHGAELPWLTRLVFKCYPGMWLVPALVLLAWVRPPWPARRARVACLVGVAGLMIVLPVVVFALYLPIFRLAQSVG